MSQFVAGQAGTIGGIQYRVVPGKKHPHDLRIDLRAVSFVPVKMAVGFLLDSFFVENEDYLFPPSQGFEGGAMYRRFRDGAAFVGWEAAAEQLEVQRAAKRAA